MPLNQLGRYDKSSATRDKGGMVTVATGMTGITAVIMQRVQSIDLLGPLPL